MKSAKILSNHFGKALKLARKSRHLSQEDFCLMSSRTYVSSLERGLKSPTLNKVDELAAVLEIHPLTLLTLAYASNTQAAAIESLIAKITQELTSL